MRTLPVVLVTALVTAAAFVTPTVACPVRSDRLTDRPPVRPDSPECGVTLRIARVDGVPYVYVDGMGRRPFVVHPALLRDPFSNVIPAEDVYPLPCPPFQKNPPFPGRAIVTSSTDAAPAPARAGSTQSWIGAGARGALGLIAIAIALAIARRRRLPMRVP